jgi:hypothetical protein
VVTVNQAEQAAFRQWISAGLAEHPEQTFQTLTQVYNPSRIGDARQVLALARILEPPEQEPEPEVPPAGVNSCSWCGRAHPPGGMTDQYPRPPEPMAVSSKPGPHGIPELYQPFKPSRPRVDNPGDMHCRDERDCDAARKARQEGSGRPDTTRVVSAPAERAAPAPQGPAPHQERLQELVKQRPGYQTRLGKVSGYIGHEVVYQPQRHQELRGYKGPAWLSTAVDNAELVLTGYDISCSEVSAWLTLAEAVEERSDELLALSRVSGRDGASTPPLVRPFSAERFHWGHTIRGGASTGHLISGQGAAWAQASHGGVSHPQEPTHPQGWQKLQDQRRGGADPRSRKPRKRRHYL